MDESMAQDESTAQVASQRQGEADREDGERLALRSRFLGFSSFLFIFLQSVCTAVMSLSALRFAIGVGALAMAGGVARFSANFHADAIRIPMMAVAVIGAVVNLFVVRRIRVLRARPSSQWRVRPATVQEKNSETAQIVLAFLTLLLVVAEWIAHRIIHGTA